MPRPRWRPKLRGKRAHRERWKWYMWIKKMAYLQYLRMYRAKLSQEKKIKMYRRW